MSHDHRTSNSAVYDRVRKPVPPPACPDSDEPLTEERVAFWVGRAEGMRILRPGLGWRYLLMQLGLVGSRAEKVVARLEGRA